MVMVCHKCEQNMHGVMSPHLPLVEEVVPGNGLFTAHVSPPCCMHASATWLSFHQQYHALIWLCYVGTQLIYRAGYI
jgi:hypothetical protein